MWFALIFAANLGGNLTTIGSPSNVIAIGIAKKEGIDISFFDYMKKSGILAAIQLVIAFGYLLAISPIFG
jgi:Na+/H+ antiporter NhaD/arsenite permease-like protein